MATYTVEAVLGEREFEGQHGKLKSYDLRLKDVEQVVELTRKPETAPPKAGDTLNGNLEEGFRGKKKLKLERQGNFNGGGRQRDPAEGARIIRQNALRHALKTYEIEVALGREQINYSFGEILKRAEAFETWIKEAAA